MNPIIDFFNIIQYESEIRNTNLIVHIVIECVTVIVGLFNLISIRFPKFQMNIGNFFLGSVISILLTSIISNLITLVFPFYILIFVSDYLIWFSVVQFYNKPNFLFDNQLRYYWTRFLNIKAIFSSIFMLILASYELIINNLDLTCYILLGFLLFYCSKRDLIALKNHELSNYFKGFHRYIILFSYMTVLIGFIVSQFCWTVGYFKLLLWGGPLFFTLTALVVLGIVFKERKLNIQEH